MSVRRISLLAVPLGVATLLLSGTAPAGAAPGHAGPHCRPVSATGVGQDLGGGHTTGTIYADGRELGTTDASFTVTGLDGTVATFTGPIVFTGLGGSLTAPVTGTLDVTTGDFTSTSSDLSGTGTFAGVSGDLTFLGTEDLVTGEFTETVSGTVCLEPPGRRAP
jgi:hypothetical protein